MNLPNEPYRQTSSQNTQQLSGNKINKTTQRIVGAIFFLIIAFLIAPQFMQAPPKIQRITEHPAEPNVDQSKPVITVNVDQEGTIVPPVSTKIDNLATENSSVSQQNSASQTNQAHSTAEEELIPQSDVSDVENKSPALPNTDLTTLAPTTKPNSVEPTQTTEEVQNTEKSAEAEKPGKTEKSAKTVTTKPNTALPPLVLIEMSSNQSGSKSTAAVMLPTKQNSNAQANAQKQVGVYAVQVGVFSKQSNANELTQKLKSAGYAVNVINIDGQFKVRVGNFPTESNARSMMAKLKRSGYPANIIKP